jgi:hypothetical protein
MYLFCPVDLIPVRPSIIKRYDWPLLKQSCADKKLIVLLMKHYFSTLERLISTREHLYKLRDNGWLCLEETTSTV